MGKSKNLLVLLLIVIMLFGLLGCVERQPIITMKDRIKYREKLVGCFGYKKVVGVIEKISYDIKPNSNFMSGDLSQHILKIEFKDGRNIVLTRRGSGFSNVNFIKGHKYTIYYDDSDIDQIDMIIDMGEEKSQP